MIININNPPVQAIPIGRCGENEFRAITIDVSAWIAVWPEGKVSVIYCRPDGELYPVIVNATESPIVWRPTATDTAAAGKGIESSGVNAYVDGENLIFSPIAAAKVEGETLILGG